MAKNQIIIDTNIYIKYYRGVTAIKQLFEKIGFKNMVVSDITVMELLIGCNTIQKRKETEEGIKLFKIATVDNEIIEKAILLIKRYAVSNSGNLALPDIIIAANAIYENIPLLTHNKKDFEFIKELKLHPLSK